MAAVSGPVPPRHPSPFRKVQKLSRPSATTTAHGPSTGAGGSDPYHGHEHTAKLCARFVSHLFACPDVPPPPAPPSTTLTPRLDHFIAYALHRTRLHPSVTFAALYLLQRLKARFPAAKGSSGHRLFISAFMLASKIICDDTYSNKSWCIVGQGMFALREINQMEREMCSYLEWQLNVDPTTLRDFQNRVQRDFAGPGPIHRRFSLSRYRHRSLIKVRVMSTPLCLRLLPVYPCPKMPPSFPVHQFLHTILLPPIPQRPRPTRPRLLLRHRFLRKHRPMRTGQDLSKLSRPIRARSSLRLSPRPRPRIWTDSCEAY
ncbi:hypothetical protein BJV77DRAFT_668770 [Russula vinacea]|nr:hypothetical protein BJV77DRAFT_668770 [Russula vinacea]